jgi:hypothetical protein
MGSRAAVASICSSNTTNAGALDYGYGPAITALVDRIKPSL